MPQQETLLAAPSAHHAHRVDVQQQTGRAPLRADLGIKHMRRPETEIEALKSIRMLVQQKTEIGGGRMCRRDRKQHSCPLQPDSARTRRFHGPASTSVINAATYVSSCHL